MPDQFLLYGANGYTGRLIAKYAVDYQLEPILAGRTAENIIPLAAALKLPYVLFELDDPEAVKSALSNVKLVLHCAGPFNFTSKQMIEACLEKGVHYLDINGDITVFEMLKRYDTAGKEKRVMIMPGVGFDVVPTDCIAQLLKQQLPDATHLKLAFASTGSSISHGTAITMAGKLGEGGAVRENGRIIRKPLGQHGMWVDFVDNKRFVMSIPWGDISTAYFSTGIPNIETYTGVAPKVYWLLKFQWAFNWLLRTSFVRKLIRKKIKSKPPGPTDEQRLKGKSFVWGEVYNASGVFSYACISCPEGYTLTVHSSLIIAKKVLENNFKPGFQTPATVYGTELVMEIPGTKRLK